MKRVFSLFILCLSWFYVIAGDYDFSVLQGLRDKKGNIYFEISGYNIFCSSQKGKLSDSKTITKLKKQLKINGIQAEYSDPNISLPHKIIETEQALGKNPALKFNQVFYIFEKSSKEIQYIEFYTLNQRDIFLEKEFAIAFLNGEFSGYVSDEWTAESAVFAGRKVKLGTACLWRGPNNIYGRGGQISWSIFSSAESAELDLDMRITANSVGDFTILSEDDIDVIFEGVPSIAYRVVYMGKKAVYPLIVYYIVQEVRDKFVSCVMSNYGNNRYDFELSPLLRQFMSIPDIPDWANNQFDISKLDDSANRRIAFDQEWTPNFEVRLGSVIPTGEFNRIFNFAPSADFFLCFPIKQKMSIDAGLLLAFPVGRKTFNFTYDGETMETKMRSLIGASLRYRYRHTINNNLSCNTYMGAGIAAVFTNLIKEIRDNNEKIYHSVEALNLYGGIQFNYKNFGFFVDYHRSPFTNSYKVENNFGNSFMNAGVTYYINVE